MPDDGLLIWKSNQNPFIARAKRACTENSNFNIVKTTYAALLQNLAPQAPHVPNWKESSPALIHNTGVVMT